ASTCLIPKFVNRTVGGIEKITVETTPGTTPSLKNTTAGIKYTTAGIVCIKSRIGVIIICAKSFCDIQIPIGTPITIATKTDITTRNNTTDKGSQYTNFLINQRPTTENNPTSQPDTENPIIIIIIISITGGYRISPIDDTHLKAASTSSITSRIVAKNGCIF